MLFNSLQFLLFFPVVILAYYSIPATKRWILLLIASYYFYMCWNPIYILLIVISTLVDYFAAIYMDKTPSKKQKRIFLTLSLISNLGLLFIFKYFNFFSDSLSILLQWFHSPFSLPLHTLLLPVGISFYTFQTLSYTIDVYRGDRKAEKHLGYFAVYVSFFPQLVAGPIERSTNLLPQFYKKHVFDINQFSAGIKLMLWGFFKKLFIADRLALFVNEVYNNPTEFQGISLLIATVFFAFQIYCDFSGYSDIAIGASKVMGIKLMDNFDRPYFSKSIAEFWRRWHISLSTWFKDYLYIPLGGNRVSKNRLYLNLFIVFLVSGLWHGANWTFVIWGALHGFYIVFSIITKNTRQKMAIRLFSRLDHPLLKIYQLITTFTLVCFSWIFFRANSLKDAIYIITHLFSGLVDYFSYFLNNFASSGSGKLGPILLGQSKLDFLLAILGILILESVHWIERHERMRDFLSDKSLVLRWFILYAILMLIIFLGVFGESQFLYFQF